MNLKTAIAKNTSIYTDHKDGVDFLDYNELNADVEARLAVHAQLTQIVRPFAADLIYLADARGFLLSPVADALRLPIQQARKAGKLPGSVIQKSYGKEYDADKPQIIEIAKLDLRGKSVALLDDVLATGGTACAIVEAVSELGGNVVCFSALYEVDGLIGRAILEEKKIAVHTLITVTEVKAERQNLGLPATKKAQEPASKQTTYA